MNGRVPHIVQYQGSKRILAPKILQYMPHRFDRLVEPFSGMAAISIATAVEGRAEAYHINDLNEHIVSILVSAINSPEELINDYSVLWNEQFTFLGGHLDHFYYVRELYNKGEHTPEIMLYLLARCVKGAVRYGKDGKFNQSPDKRRNGTNPRNLAQNVRQISSILKGRVSFSAVDYKDIFQKAEPGDLIYMDPPYQGVSDTRDNRYLSGVDFNEFTTALDTLNRKNIDFIVNYDGACGDQSYGQELPQSLKCKKIMLNAGLSSQSTLLGKRNTTYEALYLSEGLIPLMQNIPQQISMWEQAV